MRTVLTWIFIGLVALVAAAYGVYRFGGLTLLSAVTTHRGYTVAADIPYGDLPRQKLDIYTPDAPLPGAPVLVFFYGGSWSSGERGDYLFAAAAFATQGLTVVIPDYRLSPGVIFPTFVEDGARAVAAVAERLQEGGRARPIVLAGHSAGAHIAALLTLDERYLADAGVPGGTVVGMVGLSGPYDFLPLREAVYKAIFPEDIRDASQPINFVDGTEPPLLLLAGDADRTVDPGNSVRLAARVSEKGGRVAMKLYPGVGHIGTLLALSAALPFGKPPVVADVLGFVAGLGHAPVAAAP